MSEDVKKNIENLLEGIDEFNSKYMTYKSKTHREFLKKTLNYIKHKEQEYEALKDYRDHLVTQDNTINVFGEKWTEEVHVAYQENLKDNVDTTEELVAYDKFWNGEELESLKEKRNFLNIDNLNEYNKSLRDLQELFETSVEDSILLDTSSMSMDEVSVEIASQIMPAMRKRYIKSFKQKYNLR